MTPQPIFFAVTRSFWLGILPALALFFEIAVALVSDAGLHGPLSDLIVVLFPAWTAEGVHRVLQLLAPVTAIIVAHQRRGAARPYTLRISPDTLK
jgi:hypothetical protein